MAPVLPLRAGPHRVYVVEDHDVMRETLVWFIGAAPGLRVVGQAATAEDALREIGGAGPSASPSAAPGPCPCDVVVADYGLPGATGADLADRLGAARPGLPVVVVSIYDYLWNARRVRAAGVVAFVAKDRAATDLVPAIRAALDGGGA